MPRLASTLRFSLCLLAGALALGLAGCGGNERLSYATEVDEPYYREGQSLLKTGRKQEALSAFLKVIEQRGDDAPESHLEVGLLYLQHINDPLAAIYHFKKFLALRPNSPQAPLVRQRIDAAIREFARTLPAQPLENQLQRVDLVAALDRLKQENETLKQRLADAQAGRADPAAPAPVGGGDPLNFSFDPLPVVHTTKAPPVGSPVRAASRPPATTAPAGSDKKPATTAATPARHPRRYTVRPGDTLSKISLQVYGTKAKYKELYLANKSVLKSESDLKVGMELAIP
ncbi:MAG: LysM peptidoglycan-binding domain-containing protein [Opitutae bacterium]|nr:LysM peptidoglycan-binding domain-containing protein [Opitutae bacterium]